MTGIALTLLFLLASPGSQRSFDECVESGAAKAQTLQLLDWADPQASTLVLQTFVEHFARHPVSGSKAVCLVAGPGYSVVSRAARARLEKAGIRVDPGKYCQFVEDGEVWTVTGPWRAGPDTFLTHVTLHRFGDVSEWVAAYEYHLTKRADSWMVTDEWVSPCNPKESALATPELRGRQSQANDLRAPAQPVVAADAPKAAPLNSKSLGGFSPSFMSDRHATTEERLRLIIPRAIAWSAACLVAWLAGADTTD